MKKIAIIGASYLQQPLYLKANELNIKTIGFAWAEGAVAKDYCTRFYPISIVDKEKILEICIKENIDGILTIASDIAVTTVNFVATAMGLVGNSNLSALYSTNKYLMRQKLQEKGVRCPKFFSVNNLNDLEALSQQISFPLIVKPVDRSGSKGVTKVIKKDDLSSAVEEALSASLCKQAIIEEFINGKEVSVEMISYQGNHYNLTITDKETTGAPHFVETAHHQPSHYSQQVQSDIYEMVHKGLDALEIKNGASHPEFLISENGIYVTEIGARMGGDFIGSDLVYLSTGYDFLKGVIDVALGSFTPPAKTVNRYSGVYFYYINREQVKEIIELKPSYIIRAEIEDKPLIALKQSADRAGYFIYQHNSKIII